MSYELLIEETRKFFALHWPKNEELPAPEWSGLWTFCGSIYNYDKGGCYTLFAGDSLIYVGVSENNIAARTNNYTRMAPGARSISVESRPYEPSKPWRSKGLNGIRTLGFPEKYIYLAPALESLLIARLQPKENVAKKCT